MPHTTLGQDKSLEVRQSEMRQHTPPSRRTHSAGACTSSERYRLNEQSVPRGSPTTMTTSAKAPHTGAHMRLLTLDQGAIRVDMLGRAGSRSRQHSPQHRQSAGCATAAWLCVWLCVSAFASTSIAETRSSLSLVGSRRLLATAVSQPLRLEGKSRLVEWMTCSSGSHKPFISAFF